MSPLAGIGWTDGERDTCGPKEAPRAVPWLAFLTPPAAALVELGALYVLATSAARHTSRVPLHAVAAAAVVACLAAWWSSWIAWRAVGGSARPHGSGVPAAVRFVAKLGLLGGPLFTLLAIAEWLAVLFLDPLVT